MIGHLCIPAIDEKPASISKKIVTDILRRELGFGGLVITDALTMNALNDFRHIYTQCIQAGVDILLHPSDPDIVAQELSIAVHEKLITHEQLDETVSRILKVKEKLKRLKKTEVKYQEHISLSLKISDKSVSLLKNTPGILPLIDQSKIFVALGGEKKWAQSSLFNNYFENVFMLSNGSFSEKGKERGSSYEIGIFALFTSIAAWKGNAGIHPNEQNEILRNMRKCKYSPVVSFGNPYLLRNFQNAHVLVAAYEPSNQAQNAVIRCLQGEIEFQGKLPVKLD
jgi:beta-glucosidase-like glycosyl hydrolase